MPKISKNPTFTLTSDKFILFISNLHWNVSSDGNKDQVNIIDLEQLFSGYSGLVDVKLKYDNSGRSLGEATIVYDVEESADSAMQFYDNREFDGMPIRIKKKSVGRGSSGKSRLGSNINSRLGSNINSSLGSNINSRLGPSINSSLGPSVNSRLGRASNQSSKGQVQLEKREKTREIVSYHEV